MLVQERHPQWSPLASKIDFGGLGVAVYMSTGSIGLASHTGLMSS